MHLVWGLLLFVLTLFVFSIPLWPAFIELKRKDIFTPKIDNDDNGSAAYAINQTRRAAEINAFIRTGESVDIVSATQNIQIEPGSNFKWLDAPTIIFSDTNNADFKISSLEQETPELKTLVRNKFKRVNGNWKTSKNTKYQGDYLITQDLVLAENSVIFGSIRAYGNVKLESGAEVHGSIFTQKSITLSKSAWVNGVVSSGEEIHLHSGCTIGNIKELVSVSAPYIVAHPGAVVHGSLRATVQGTSRLL